VELTKFARLYQVPVSWLLDEDEQATADTHALALFTRKFRRLTSEDQAQVADFADYLRRPARRSGGRPATRGEALTFNWAVAHKMATMAANHAHDDTGVARDEYVDVFAALQAGGIFCIAKPLQGLAGVYAAPASGGPRSC